MSLVGAVPTDLLDLPVRTAPADAAVRAAATGALAAAAGRHAGRARDAVEAAAAVGVRLLLAGGPPGLLALALHVVGVPVPAEHAASLVSTALGLAPAPGSPVRRPATDPAAVAALAASLGAGTVTALAVSHPHLVGPVDGMPIDARYAANRRIAAAGGLTELAGTDRRLLYVDPARGHAAEVFGDLDAADHVAVVVPGMGNALARFETVTSKAVAIRAAAADLDPPADVATVAWLGYDSPTVDVVLDGAAEAGGPALARFVAGLGAGQATVTVVGHSYGTVVTGYALRAGLDVDAVSVTGSPGMRAGRASDLGDTPVYALRAPWDYVSATAYYGTDPSDADFGAVRLDTGRMAGHAGYFAAGSESLRNLALVAAGRADEADRLPDGAYDRAVDVLDDVHELVDLDLPDLLVHEAQRLVGGPFETIDHLLSPDFVGDVVGDALDYIR